MKYWLYSVDSLLRMRSAGILTYLEKKWLLEQFSTPANHVQSSTFQPVEYMHIRLTVCLLVATMIVSAFICILENVWYRLREKSQGKNCNLTLSGYSRGGGLSLTKARSRQKWRKKSNLTLLLLDARNAEFFENVTVRINQWQMSHSRL